MMIFVVVGILDLKISEISKLTEGVNILIYIVPLLIILVLIFEQFKKNLRD
jgi:Na+/glutamate symporter